MNQMTVRELVVNGAPYAIGAGPLPERFHEIAEISVLASPVDPFGQSCGGSTAAALAEAGGGVALGVAAGVAEAAGSALFAGVSPDLVSESFEQPIVRAATTRDVPPSTASPFALQIMGCHPNGCARC